MDIIISFLQEVPDDNFIKTICLLIFTSCSGLIPNNNDISLAAAGLISHLKNLSPYNVALMATLSWMTGESLVFMTGRFLGRKIFNINFIKLKMNEQRQLKITQLINENPFSLIFMIRLTPVLRACSILTMGSLGLSPFNFVSKHLPLLFVYSFCIFFFFYYGGVWLKSMFAEYSILAMAAIIILWISVMILIGKKFLAKLK